MSFSSDFDSSSRRAQETASPESSHAPRNAEGRSICIKAEKIVSDRGPKGMRDSKPAGQPSSDVDPRSHVDIGEPRPEVWTYFRGEPACVCVFQFWFRVYGFCGLSASSKFLGDFSHPLALRLSPVLHVFNFLHVLST
ncbi:hypothetical protein B0H14DRAFT_2586207 [Mycena olivaceomarginata]|nr:hypothetical protein B0H14DRAFT_2586207 [Mycena olivaceomarginata]